MATLISPINPAAQAANQVVGLASQQFTQLQQAGKSGYTIIWNNPYGLTPQQVISALGTNAKMVFELQALNQSTLMSAANIAGVVAPVLPSIPNGYTLTFNSDGSATVSQSSSSSSGS
jgi:hypothetical protein